MNNEEKTKGAIRAFFQRMDGKMKDILLLVSLAILLFVSAWQIFHAEESEQTSLIGATQEETKVIRLLEEMEGVGEANVIVCKGENGNKNVVVVCEGADNLHVVIRVREAVAAALGIEEKAVKVYLKKE